jgi:glycosyltransferase involved in cell wall biosynthesis
LFVGVDWSRKGGEIAVSAVRELRKQIPSAVLTVVGCNPVLPAEDREFCEVKGVLRKSQPEELRQLIEIYQKASAFILPTRADCAPVAFAEACGFGLPCFGTSVGGVATLVRDGYNGCLLPVEARASVWADAMANVFEKPEVYNRYSECAYNLWRRELNWEAAGARVTEVLRSMVSQ